MKRVPPIRSIEFCVVILVLFIGNSVVSQNLNTLVSASINVNDAKNDILEISGIAKNLMETTYSLKYELSVITSNENNNSSKSAQSGFFTLGPFETKILSHTSISINPDNRTIILLLIYNEDEILIATDRIVYDIREIKKEKEEVSYQKENEGIQLTGMVIERTKTKPGKDFYDIFYQKYSLNPDQSNKIIEIDEMISFGRTTRIMVKIDNLIIYQFFARPKLDYLEEMATEALKQVNRYFEYLKNRSENLTQY